jgi:hypothetical protein
MLSLPAQPFLWTRKGHAEIAHARSHTAVVHHSVPEEQEGRMSQINERACAILVAMALVMSILGSAASTQAATPRYVTGKVYINGAIVSDGIAVRLVFDGQTIATNTFDNGDYRLNFDENNYEEGVFSVSYLGTWYKTTPPGLELGEQNEFSYGVNLNVTVPPPAKKPRPAPGDPLQPMVNVPRGTVLRQAQDERQQGWTSPLVLRQAQDERYWLTRSW